VRPGCRRVEEWPIDRPDQGGSGAKWWVEWDDPMGDNWDGNDIGTLDGCDVWGAPA
jgi:hypothetical protein